MATRPLLTLLRDIYPDRTKDELFAHVLCGDVRVDGERVKDPKRRVATTAHLELAGRGFVSRGGEKLDAALTSWQLDATGKVFLDAGASTGGFTDCLLQHGARAVHAVDVGFNQLAWRLRTDERVIVHESTSILDLTSVDPPADGAVCDLSFRSLTGVSSSLLSLAGEGWFVALIKPQFEWRTAPEHFDGVVRDRGDAHAILADALYRLAAEGAHVQRLMPSPIRGRRGNHEYLALFGRDVGPKVTDLIAALEEAW